MDLFRKEPGGKYKKLSPAVLLFIGLFGISLILSFFLAGKGQKNKQKNKISTAVDMPVFSVVPGVYHHEFSVELKGAPADGTIYYTLDGSKPSPESFKYSYPITISQSGEDVLMNIPTSPRWKTPIGNFPRGTVLRAAVFLPDGTMSSIATASYFILPKGKTFTLPIVSLVTDRDNLFGYDKGIFVMGRRYEDKDNYVKKNIRLDIPWWEYPANYRERGNHWVRPVSAEFFESEGNEICSANAGLRIHGNATRGFSQKSLRLEFNRKQGTSEFNCNVFPGSNVTSFHSLILRNGGNDWTKTMMRDALMQQVIAKGTSLDAASYRAAIVFVNGEYWGIHMICERLDENSLASKYNTDPDSIAIIEPGAEVLHSSNDEASFGDIVSYAEASDLSVETSYQKLSSMMDIDNFIDYLIVEMYFTNTDWPTNNLQCWRFKGSNSSARCKDGKWRWIIHDMDYGMGYTSAEAYRTDMFAWVQKDKVISVLLNSLMKNEQFRSAFTLRAGELLDQKISGIHMENAIDSLRQLLLPEMPQHVGRWRVIPTVDDWNDNVQELKIYNRKRPAVFLEQLKAYQERYKQP